MAEYDTELDAIAAALPEAADAGYVVAFSGGLDSTALLHYLARSDVRPLRAVHVQHDLQPAAPDWAEDCRARAATLDVPITVVPVHVDCHHSQGPEAAARETRYAALAAAMQPGEVLLTAHHADDQAQTFLLQALRGSGIRGLAGMPAVTAFGPGRHARPMLAIGRDAINAYVRARGLDWLTDPSNADPSVDRSYLDTHIWPAIRQRWPHAAATLSRAAGWCAESAVLDAERADADLAHCAGETPDCLDLTHARALSPARRRGLLRQWLQRLELPPPGRQHLEHIESDCFDAGRNARSLVTWPGAEVRVYRDRLYATPPLAVPRPEWGADWRPESDLSLPSGGTLAAERAPGGLHPAGDYHVRLRRGGERIRLPGRAHDTPLRTALQDAGVPPWARERLPLILAGEHVAAVADLWICEGFAADTDVHGWHPRWRDPPPGWPSGGGGDRPAC